MKISASVYSNSNGSLQDLVANLDQHGIDFFHIDCNDDPSVFDDIEEIRKYSDTPIDLHLITSDPEPYFEAINRLDIEMVTLQYEVLEGYQYRGGLSTKMGIAVVTDTEIETIEKEAEHYDFVLMMATTPGQSGGAFNKINFKKIRQFKRDFPSKPIHVDGGVNAEVSFILRNIGVDVSVVGSYLFKDMPLGAALLNLKTHDIDSHYVVSDFMRDRAMAPIVGPEGRTIKKVIETIEDYKLGFTMLEDEGQKFEGIVSNADLRRELLRNLDDPSKMSVSGMINTSPVFVESETTVSDMLTQLKGIDFPVNYLPVLSKEHEVVGVISFLNLVKGEL